MKKSRYTEEQVIDAVKRVEAGRKAKELAGAAAARSGAGERAIEETGRELSLDKDALQTVIRKSGWSL